MKRARLHTQLSQCPASLQGSGRRRFHGEAIDEAAFLVDPAAFRTIGAAHWRPAPADARGYELYVCFHKTFASLRCRLVFWCHLHALLLLVTLLPCLTLRLTWLP
mgnify:CR=1 FL=1